MKVTRSVLEGVVFLIPEIWSDNRGVFFEAFKDQDFRSLGLPHVYPQENISESRVGVVRGLHFQRPPFEQGKIVRCIQGRIFDVVVDIRPGSKTFGKHESYELTAEDRAALFIPVGFAHGFQALTEGAAILYKCTQVFSIAHDGGINPFDPALAIPWPLPPGEVSGKDRAAPTLAQYFGKI